MSWLQRAWNTLSIAGPLLPRPGVYTVTLDCTESVVRAIEAMYGAGNQHLLQRILRSQTDMAKTIQDVRSEIAAAAADLETEIGQIQARLEEAINGGSQAELEAAVADLGSLRGRIAGIVEDTPEPGEEEEDDGA